MGLELCDLSDALMLSHINTRKEGQTPSIGLGWQLDELDAMKIVWHDGETGGYRSFIGFVKNEDKGVLVLTNSNADINDIGFHMLNPSSVLNKPKPSIGMELRRIINRHGIQDLEKSYHDLSKLKKDAFEFGENELHMLGNLYLDENDVSKALAVFKINVDSFPNSSDAYYDYGKALARNNQSAEAIVAFQKSIEHYSGNTASLTELEKLGVSINQEVIVADSILEKYVGTYELLPGLLLEVFKENNQLKAQATGKSEHLIYPKSTTIFYFKSLPAQITFNISEDGKVGSLTYTQEGDKLVAKRIDDHQQKQE